MQEKEPMKGDASEQASSGVFGAQVAIFKEIWPLGVSLWAIFAITLAAFPALCVKILSTSEDRLWAGLFTFLCFIYQFVHYFCWLIKLYYSN